VHDGCSIPILRTCAVREKNVQAVRKVESIIIHISFFPSFLASKHGNKEKQTPKKAPSGGKI
jgi:hypothetical protein